MPESPSQSVSAIKKDKAERSFMIAGTKNGIQKIYEDGKIDSLWSGGSVSKIIKSETAEEDGKQACRT